MVWYNGDELGHLDIADLFGPDTAVTSDMVTVIGFLGRHPGAVYIDSLGFGEELQGISALWRPSASAATVPAS